MNLGSKRSEREVKGDGDGDGDNYGDGEVGLPSNAAHR